MWNGRKRPFLVCVWGKVWYNRYRTIECAGVNRRMDLDALGMWLGWLLMAGYAALTVTELPRFFRSALASPVAPPPEAGAPVSRRWLWGEVLIAFAASRLLVALVCLVAHWIDSRSLAGFFGALGDNLFPWDARHYIHIIENGYVAAGEERLFIVFFPLYPLACRCVWLLTGLPADAVALAASNAALIGAGAALYRLVELDGDGAKARRAMLLMMFCPMTYFFSIAYSESTFLLMTLLAVLCARRRRFAPALLFGALASGARLLGMATAIPIFWELLRASREARGGEAEPLRGGELARCVTLCALKTLPVSLGFLTYLYINWRLFGNPTQFLIFQSEHWFQNFATIGNTFRYSLYNALNYDDFLYRLGVWWPQVALLIAVPLLVLWRRRRERPGDVAFALVYHYVAFAPTWLLSGPRYASCNYALYPMLAGIPQKRRTFALMLAVECVLLAYMTWVGLWRGKVY